MLVHLSKNSHGTYSFNPVVLNFMIELAKTTFALITLLMFVSSRDDEGERASGERNCQEACRMDCKSLER